MINIRTTRKEVKGLLTNSIKIKTIISNYEGYIKDEIKNYRKGIGIMGKVISISSVKGGVGKTTLTLNLAGISTVKKACINN